MSGIKSNELQKLSSILETDCFLVDAAAGTRRVSFKEAARYFKQVLLEGENALKTAYDYAVEGGYEGSEAEFAAKLAKDLTAEDILLSDGKTTIDTALETLAADNKVLSRVLGTLDPLSGEGAPTESTVGAIGQKYTDTTTGDIYTCIAVSAGEEGEPSYIWIPGNIGTMAEIRAKLHDLSEALSNKVDVIPREWYDLPITSNDWVNHTGWGANLYTKTATGVVHLHLSIQGTSYITDITPIAQLPVGFRPAYGYVTAVGLDPSTNNHVAITISSNGEICLRPAPTTQGNFKYAVVDACFFAWN